ncbi:TrkH family potassium uptake protein [Desulfobulbus rhabdoformis]|uniref:TrkH family potassium uptake protein n=1 Tax=Desulfobulbus rhabdoformis TaxID=34032 RepID=UPI0019652C2B|nr:TrkH family potassium uptake protein [Desulfobulbus rhabdoformis]MBM9614360.1 TrkH family potassium uptake protein [Desulfobulbus rhabdoformis]
MKITAIVNVIGIILVALGTIMLTPISVALITGEYGSILPFVVACGSSVALGFLFQWYGGFSRDFDNLKRTEGMLIVTLAWLVTGCIGAIPFLFYQLGPLDAYFESISGFTTTGATILKDFAPYPKTFFFWRSLSQWLGGMGIIVLFVAILPQFAVAGRQMFFAEAPGPTEEKVTPRITHTAKALWMIYILLTLLEMVVLSLQGMPVFDAVCNSFSTMAAGGFSPNGQSIQGYNSSSITWTITLFMFLAGGNFALQYRVFFQAKFRSLINNEEFRFYLIIVVVMSLLLCSSLMLVEGDDWQTGLRESFFQIASIITTTGFASEDFGLWAIPAQTILFTMMLVGGCAGSAGGGVKVVRVLFGLKYLKREIAQVVHPKAVLPIKIDRVTVPGDIQRQILGFLLFYIALATLSSLIVTVIEHDPVVGIIGTAATIGNIGPGYGTIGPMGSFGNLSPWTKGIFIVDMVVGRLELIPFLAMLHPDFWTFKRKLARKG